MMNGIHLKLMLEIIDTCAQRGAFKGDELLAVGSLRSAVDAELEIIKPYLTKLDKVNLVFTYDDTVDETETGETTVSE